WDFKPPGIFLTYALAQGVFGKSMLSIRLLEVIGLVATVFGMQRLGQVFFDKPRAGLVAGAMAALIQAELEFWHTAQPETFGGYLTIAALVVTTLDVEPARRWRVWLATGALFGMCALYKPPLGGGILVCGAYLLTREQTHAVKWPKLLRVSIIIGAGFALPIALTLLWIAARGAWPAFWWTFHEFVPGYTKLNWSDAHAPGMLYYGILEAFVKFSALSAFGVIAAITMTPLYGREREGIFLVLGIVAIQITGIVMQGKFFPYHYGATLLMISMLSGLGIYKLFRRSVGAGFGSVLALIAFVVVAIDMRDAVNDLPQGFWERTQIRASFLLRRGPFRSRADLDRELSYVADYNLDADRQVALDVRSRTASSDPIFIWGFEPSTYFLAERPLASRWTYDVPQRTTWQRSYARRELLHDLSKNRPKVIVVERRDVFPSVTGSPLDSRDELPNFPELKALIDSQYRKVREIEDFDIYERSEL
ncbi:MAG TPA: glycosyltransferase family 39 protein, partial [Polyangiaceae bacterium]|nr:glycosyltransferase family 39 protein [Polyangiaceae bacterium]